MVAEVFHIEVKLLVVFIFTILTFLIIDLFILNKKSKIVSTFSTLLQTIFWISVSIVFGLVIRYYLPESVGGVKMWEYFTAYATEKALSVDNIFVIILILKYFKVKREYYHKILFWGVLGALVFRGIFIYIGSELVRHATAILYIFGVILLYSGIKLYFEDKDDDYNPKENKILQLCKKYLNISKSNYGGKFFVRENGVLLFTPIFLVVVLIETTDIIFAVDSIPAAFGITQDTFILYTSNIFAVLGLRAMFFLLESVLDRFYLLQKGLSLILIFIGGKMLAKMSFIENHVMFVKSANHFFEKYPQWSFCIVFGILALSILLSVIFPKKEKRIDSK